MGCLDMDCNWFPVLCIVEGTRGERMIVQFQ